MEKLKSFLRFAGIIYSKILLLLGISLIIIISIKGEDNKLINFPSIPVEGDTVLSFSVKPRTYLILPFITSKVSEVGTKVQLFLTDFKDKYGNNVAIEPNIVELPNSKPMNQRLSFILSDSIMTLKLKIPDLPSEGKFKGNLIVRKNGVVKQVNTIILTRAIAERLAHLTMDLKEIDINNSSSFTLLLRNESPDWKAKGIFLRLLGVTTPEGVNFNSGKNISFKWNNKATSDMWYPPSLSENDSAKRDIAPYQKGEISGDLINLSPGEYTLKLGIAAVNGMPENEQQVTLKIKVHDNIWWAVLVLFLGILMAFITNKVLVTLNFRSETLKKISQIRPSWLTEVADSLPVVCLKVILKQVEERNRNIFVALCTSPDVIKERLNRAESISKIIDRLRILREKINSWTDDRMIVYHAEKQLRKIETDLNWESGDKTFLDNVTKTLDNLEKWENQNQRYNLFWIGLKKEISSIGILATSENFDISKHDKKTEVNWNKIEDLQKYLKHINFEKMDRDIKVDLNDTVRKEIIDISHVYAKLKLLWECKENEDDNLVNRLLDSIKKDPKLTSVEDFWKIADNDAWEKIKEATEKKEKIKGETMEFTLPLKNEIYPKRIFELIQFKIFPKDKRLANNYLFKYGLEYLWTLKINRKKFLKGKDEKCLTNPRTNEPRLVQYFPMKGKHYDINVKIRYKGDESEAIKMFPLEIKKSGDFGFKAAFQTVEVVPTILAMIFAIFSGLQINYFSNPVFGTTGNYITLFLWGAAVDVGKNFIQYYQQTKKT